ncbi:hypothetical protein [Streptomyces sp. NPDC001340]
MGRLTPAADVEEDVEAVELGAADDGGVLGAGHDLLRRLLLGGAARPGGASATASASRPDPARPSVSREAVACLPSGEPDRSGPAAYTAAATTTGTAASSRMPARLTRPRRP